MADNMELRQELARNAAEFSVQLQRLADFYGDNFSQVVRKTVLDLFGNIIVRSPVDNGSYRASHGIANHEPSADEGVVVLDKTGKDRSKAAGIARAKGRAWTWQLGWGDIYLFNNLPYAEPLENGHSKQAPEGVYRQAMAEISGVMAKQISGLSTPFEGNSE